MARSHSKSLSNLNKVLPIPITLEDRTPEEAHFLESSHITDVLVGDHHIIEGEGGKPYMVWLIRIIINESNYTSISIYKRYREIEKLRNDLIKEYKNLEIPKLPEKDSLSFQRMMWTNNWLEHRRKGLQWFMTNVLLNPQLQHSKLITDFILS